MDKKIKKAIDALNNQKSKLDSGKSLNNQIWRTQLLSSIAQYFSEESPEYKFLSRKYFYVDEYNSGGSRIPASSQQADLLQKISEAKEFIDNCIETIKINGVYKKPNENFVSHLKNWAILSIIVTIYLAGIFTVKWFEELKSPSLPSSNSTSHPITNGKKDTSMDSAKYKNIVVDTFR